MSLSDEAIKYPLLIDGGLSNQLESQGCNLNHPLWTARLIKDDPEQVVQAHLAYLEAGAQCIATMSYQASRLGYTKLGYTDEEADQLILSSVDLAHKAVERFLQQNNTSQKPLVAASIGPYGAALADGSEYKGAYGVSSEDLQQFHETRIALLDKSSADLLAIETIPSLQEAIVLKNILMDVETPTWISFSCRNDQQISDGTPIEEVINLFKNLPAVFAIGVNCTAPEYIGPLIDRIKATGWQKHIVVYPNLGETYNATTKKWDETNQQLFGSAYVSEWLERGADIIGGCCRVGPQEISEVKHYF